MSFHTIILLGRVTKEPEMRYTPDGKAVCAINVAVNDGFGENKKTIWFRVTAWEKQADNCNNYLVKGQEILVEGRLQHNEGNPRTFTRNDGTVGSSFEITASRIVFRAKPKGADSSTPAENAVEDDDIPF